MGRAVIVAVRYSNCNDALAAAAFRSTFYDFVPTLDPFAEHCERSFSVLETTKMVDTGLFSFPLHEMRCAFVSEALRGFSRCSSGAEGRRFTPGAPKCEQGRFDSYGNGRFLFPTDIPELSRFLQSVGTWLTGAAFSAASPSERRPTQKRGP